MSNAINTVALHAAINAARNIPSVGKAMFGEGPKAHLAGVAADLEMTPAELFAALRTDSRVVFHRWDLCTNSTERDLKVASEVAYQNATFHLVQWR